MLPALPQNVLEALSCLNARGFDAYVVGGCVRDMLMGVPPHDFDICTAAPPEETIRCFAGKRIIETGLKHGTVTVLIGGEAFEITTFRTEGDYLDGRHPSSVSFTRNIENDLMRRDFTVNAMAYHPEKGLVDLYGGQQDIADRTLRCVGDPRERLTEDALRILRAVRFSAQLGFDIEKNTGDAMLALRDRLKLISRERIAAELLKTFASPHAPQTLRAYSAILEAALPGCTLYDVDALAATPAGHTLLRTAALLHRTPDAEEVLRSLKLSVAFTEGCLMLIGAYDAAIPPDEVPLWLAKMGRERFSDLLLVRSEEERRILRREMQRALDDKLPLSLREMCINGRDLMEQGFSAGPEIGQILTALHEAVLLRQIPHTREALLKKAKSI